MITSKNDYPTRDTLVQDVKAILKRRNLSIREISVYENMLAELDSINDSKVKDAWEFDLYKD